MMYKKMTALLILFVHSFTQSKFLLIMGPSGTGKSTIIRHLKNLDERFEYVTPLTTRQLRDGERDKIHVSIEEIENLKGAGKLLAVNHIYGIYYATPRETIDDSLAKGSFPVLDWPIEKLSFITEQYGEKLYTVYLEPDNAEELQRRLSQDDRDKDGKRYEAGIKEMHNLATGKYDNLVDLKLVNKVGCDKEIARCIYKKFLDSLKD